MRRLFASIAAALTAATPSLAHAGGFFTRFAGEEGVPTTDHVAATYYNPAGLAMRRGTRFVLETNVGYRAARYTRSVDAIDNILEPGEVGSGTPEDALAAQAGPATLENPLFLPFLGVATDFGVPNLGVGFSVSAPFGGSASWDTNDAFATSTDYPGAVDGTQRWVAIEGEQRSLYLTLAGAYYIPAAKLSFGVGVNFIMSSVNLLRARNVDGTDHLVTSTGMLIEGRSLLDVSGNQLSVGAGLQLQPTPKVRIGIAYQSQPGFGEGKLAGTLTNKFGAGATTVSDVELVQSLPDVVRVGVAFQATDELELRLSGDFQHWSVFDKQCVVDATMASNCALNPDGSAAADGVGIVANIPREWDNAWGVRLGASYDVHRKVRVQGGVSYDKSPIPDEFLDAGLLDLDKVVLAAGARFGVGGGFDVVAGWTQVVYFEKTTPNFPRKQVPTRVPGNAGRYQQDVGLFQLSLEYAFE